MSRTHTFSTRQRRQFLAQTLGLSALAVSSPLTFAQAKPTIKIGFVDGWSDSVATTHLAAAIIRSKLGNPVELVPLAAGIMWQGVAVQILGANYPGAKIGLIVPEYVKATSLADLNSFRADFDNRIVGIDAGAGVMRKTEEAIKAYGLEMRLLPSSGPAMAAELDRAYRANKAIAVTGWIPHWMFAKYKLRFLADPKNIYGAEEHVDSVINPNLNAKAPAVVAFLKKLPGMSEPDYAKLVVGNMTHGGHH